MSNRKKHARSWKKMLRARTNMKNRGYELEVDEFVRTELSIAGKKRTTNVWMDYVKEQTIAEEQQDQRQQQAQYAIQELRDLKRQRTERGPRRVHLEGKGSGGSDRIRRSLPY